MAKRKFKSDKKSDKVRKAKPAGYRYRVGTNKDHPLYYKHPSAAEIDAYEAGNKRMRARIYKEGRVDHSDSSQVKKLGLGGAIKRLFKSKPKEPKVKHEYEVNVYENGKLRNSPIFSSKYSAEQHEKDMKSLGYKVEVKTIETKYKKGGEVKKPKRLYKTKK